MAKRGDPREFTVEGSGSFPIDMLRYDACWPVSEAHDSPAVAMTRDDPAFFELRRVVLRTTSENSPTPARWSSFSWRFVGAGEQRDTGPFDPRDLNVAGGPPSNDAELKAKTIKVLDTAGLIPAVRFYRAALYHAGKGDPGLYASLGLIRDKWAKEPRSAR